VQHPVLLRVELEVLQPCGDRMLAAEVGELDAVRQEVVALVTVHLLGRAGRMRRELPADQLQVVGARPVGVGDTAVPSDQSCARLDHPPKALERVGGDLRHGDRLHDQVGCVHRRLVGVDLGRLLDAHLEPVLAQERHEQLGGLGGGVAAPSAPHDQRL